MQTIGKRLAEIRKSRKFKQIELAEMLNEKAIPIEAKAFSV